MVVGFDGCVGGDEDGGEGGGEGGGDGDGKLEKVASEEASRTSPSIEELPKPAGTPVRAQTRHLTLLCDGRNCR